MIGKQALTNAGMKSVQYQPSIYPVSFNICNLHDSPKINEKGKCHAYQFNTSKKVRAQLSKAENRVRKACMKGLRPFLEREYEGPAPNGGEQLNLIGREFGQER